MHQQLQFPDALRTLIKKTSTIDKFRSEFPWGESWLDGRATPVDESLPQLRAFLRLPELPANEVDELSEAILHDRRLRAIAKPQLVDSPASKITKTGSKSKSVGSFTAKYSNAKKGEKLKISSARSPRDTSNTGSPDSNFGMMLTRYMEAHDIKMDEKTLAEKSGVPQTIIENMLSSGRYAHFTRDMIAVAKTLGCRSLDDFVKKATQLPPPAKEVKRLPQTEEEYRMFGILLGRLMDKRGYKPKDKKALAEKADITPASLDNILYGKTKTPHPETITGIIKALGCSNYDEFVQAVTAPRKRLPIEPEFELKPFHPRSR
jgi:hypothetical protein